MRSIYELATSQQCISLRSTKQWPRPHTLLPRQAAHIGVYGHADIISYGEEAMLVFYVPLLADDLDV